MRLRLVLPSLFATALFVMNLSCNNRESAAPPTDTAPTGTVVTVTDPAPEPPAGGYLPHPPTYGALRNYPVASDADLLLEGFAIGDTIQESTKGWRVGKPDELGYPGHKVTRVIAAPPGG